MNQGCYNEGSDSRLFGRWGCRIANALSWQTPIHPVSLLVALPPYVAFNVPIPFVSKDRRYLHVRAGWRYDVNWPGYIFDFALKAKHVPILY